MKPADKVMCANLPCTDIASNNFLIPRINVQPETISIILISEASPPNLADTYYAGENALFARTTVMAFQDAGLKVESIKDILAKGVYMTTAIKCGKTGFGISTQTIQNCSYLLEKELDLFPNVKVYLLMGDVAIKSLNTIARRNGESRVIPVGSTYKIRGGEFHFRGKRVFPSYVQAGPAFFVEKSKRKMIAEDIRKAFDVISDFYS